MASSGSTEHIAASYSTTFIQQHQFIHHTEHKPASAKSLIMSFVALKSDKLTFSVWALRLHIYNRKAVLLD